MDGIYRQQNDQPQRHYGDVSISRNYDTASYWNQEAYEGNKRPSFGNKFPTANYNCYDSQIPGSAKWNYVNREDYHRNGTTYRGEVRTHENSDKSERISHRLGRNFYGNNSTMEIYRNHGFKCSHSSTSCGHNQEPPTNSDDLLSSGSSAYYDATKRNIKVADCDQAVYSRYKQAPVRTASYYGNQSVALYDVQNTTGQYSTYMSKEVNWTSSRNVNFQDSTQKYFHSETTLATRPNHFSNETLPHGTRGSSSDNLQHYGSFYRQRNEHEKETNDGHRTMWSYQQQNSLSKPNQISDLISRKRKLDGKKPGSVSKQEINNNDVSTSTSKVDKRALYSKFRVVKRKDQSQTFSESTKVKPLLLRFKLGDKTIVDVNDQDGLPKQTKRAKIVPTVTPVKENEAEATIGNIEFITLDNMKVVRRKLGVVELVRREEERQERLKAEAKVKAKVKVNAKARMRTNKKHKNRRHSNV